MKNQALFSSKDKRKKLKCCQLQFLFGALRVYCFTGDSTSDFLTGSKTNAEKLTDH